MGAALPKLNVGVECREKETSGDVPCGREAASLVALDQGRLFLYGGGSSSPNGDAHQYNDEYILSTKDWKWKKMITSGQAPCPRTGQASVILKDGSVLVFGGCSLTHGYLNDVYMLDTKAWTWRQLEVKGQVPSPRDKHSLCVVGDHVILFGGFGPSNFTSHGDRSSSICTSPPSAQSHDIFVELQRNRESFSGTTSGRNSDASNASLMSDEAKLVEQSDEQNNVEALFTWFNDVYLLNTERVEWTKIQATGSIPTPRAAHSAISITLMSTEEKSEAQMLVFGGRDKTGRQSDAFILDPVSWAWTSCMSKPVPSEVSQKVSQEERPKESHVRALTPAKRSFHAMAQIPETQFAVSFGGTGADGQPIGSLDILDISSMNWFALSQTSGPWPPPRSSASLCVVSVPKQEPRGRKRQRKSKTQACYPVAVIFGGSSCKEGFEPEFYNDVHVIDLEPLLNFQDNHLVGEQ